MTIDPSSSGESPIKLQLGQEKQRLASVCEQLETLLEILHASHTTRLECPTCAVLQEENRVLQAEYAKLIAAQQTLYTANAQALEAVDRVIAALHIILPAVHTTSSDEISLPSELDAERMRASDSDQLASVMPPAMGGKRPSDMHVAPSYTPHYEPVGGE